MLLRFSPLARPLDHGAAHVGCVSEQRSHLVYGVGNFSIGEA